MVRAATSAISEGFPQTSLELDRHLDEQPAGPSYRAHDTNGVHRDATYEAEAHGNEQQAFAFALPDDASIASDTSDADQTLRYMITLLHSWLFLAEVVPCLEFHAASPSKQLGYMHDLISRVEQRNRMPAQGVSAGVSPPLGLQCTSSYHRLPTP